MLWWFAMGVQALTSQKGKKGNRPKGLEMSRQRYETFINAYRRFPWDGTHHKKVAALIGCDERTAKNLWNQGWKGNIAKARMFEWARPIKEILLTQQRAARHAFNHNENIPDHIGDAPELPVKRSVQDKQREEAEAARAQEARLIATSRGNVIALQAIIATCLRGALTMTSKIEESFKTGEVSTREAFRIISRLGDLVHQSSAASKSVLEAERLRVGLPQAIIGLVPLTDMTPEQAGQDIQRASMAFERAKRLGIVSLPSGKQIAEAKVLDLPVVQRVPHIPQDIADELDAAFEEA